MRDLVRQFKTDPQIRDKAVGLIMYTPPKDWGAQVYAVWQYVRDTIKYVKDINEVETLYYPTQVMEQKFGDCDDQATLIAALLESIGHPTRFHAVGFQPGVFSHVYTETLIGNQWWSVETTEDVQPGWQPAGVVSNFIVRN